MLALLYSQTTAKVKTSFWLWEKNKVKFYCSSLRCYESWNSVLPFWQRPVPLLCIRRNKCRLVPMSDVLGPVHSPSVAGAKKSRSALLDLCSFLLTAAEKVQQSTVQNVFNKNCRWLSAKIIKAKLRNGATLLSFTKFESLRGTVCFLFRQEQ